MYKDFTLQAFLLLTCG